MSEERFTPDEFARLVSLPASHPDRQRAERTSQFEAWRVMLREFEQPSGAPLSAAELAAAGRELERRVVQTLDPISRVVTRPSWSGALSAWLRGPASRPALALAAIVVVTGAALWVATSRPPGPRAVRGAGEAPAIVLAPPRAVEGGIELRWTPVAGAEAYRVVFYGADLGESARVDGLSAPRLVLRRDALPSGLQHGGQALVEVTALRGGDPVATSPTRAITLP